MEPSTQHGYAPTLDSFVHAKLPLDACIETAVSLLKRRQVRGPEACALATAHVLSRVVAKARWADVDQLLDRVQQVGRKLVDAQPQELVIGNIVRRVLGLIRDEALEDRNENGNESLAGSVPDLRAAAAGGAVARAAATRQPSLIAGGAYQSMFSLLSAADSSLSGSGSGGSGGGGGGDVSSAGGSGTSTPVPPGHGHGPGHGGGSRVGALRDEILEGIEEIKDEIGQADDQIAGFAEGQIRPGDCVLVHEPTRTVEKFLIKAAARRRYTLLLARTTAPATATATATATADDAAGRYAPLLKRLTAAKVGVVQIAGSAAAAYMTRVHRVVVDARAIGAHGGVVANAGSARLARAAHAHGRTVVVVGGVYRLAPEPFGDPEALVEWGDPGRLVPFAHGGMADGIEVAAAVTEYVPPALIDIYVTNLGPHSRDYLESVIADHYKTDDLALYQS